MINLTSVLLYLTIISSSLGNKVLRIFRNSEEFYTPVRTVELTERAGHNLTLSCELHSDVYDNSVIDDQITWWRISPSSVRRPMHDLEEMARKKKDILIKPSEVNKAVQSFLPLKLTDSGTYLCISFKYVLFQVIKIDVRNFTSPKNPKQDYDDVPYNSYCNGVMFQCMANGACINQRYVCDGKEDCSDGSDESFSQCNGNACEDKIQCDERCIPKYWCCDKHTDPNCNVTYKPKCCPTEDTEYAYGPYNITQPKPRHSDFVFIIFCIFVMIVILVGVFILMSKMFFLVSKQGGFGNMFAFDDVQRSDRDSYPSNLLTRTCRNRLILSNVRYNSNCPDALETGQEMTDLLPQQGAPISFSTDQPPSYADIVTRCDPPPPYTSQECLNVTTGR